MADLDQELRDALQESEQQAADSQGDKDAGATPEAPPVAVQSETESEAAPKRNLGLLAALLIAAGGILTLVFTSVDDAAIYSMTTDKLLEQKQEYVGKNVRVEGDLVSGSLRHRKEPCEYRFDIEKNGARVAVRYPECIVPDTFKDVPGIEVQVTAEGKLTEDGHFAASHIMAKCPSKYEMQQRAAKGESAPHQMVDESEVPDFDEDTKSGTKQE